MILIGIWVRGRSLIFSISSRTTVGCYRQENALSFAWLKIGRANFFQFQNCHVCIKHAVFCTYEPSHTTPELHVSPFCLGWWLCGPRMNLGMWSVPARLQSRLWDLHANEYLFMLVKKVIWTRARRPGNPSSSPHMRYFFRFVQPSLRSGKGASGYGWRLEDKSNSCHNLTPYALSLILHWIAKIPHPMSH